MRRSRPSGVSLVELMVASAIVGILMIEIWGLVRAGSQFYLKVKGQGDIQRNSLLALRWMAKDLSQGSSISFREFNTVDSTGASSGYAHAGIVFGSPLSPTGEVDYDSGRMLWSSVVGYFIEPSDGGLYRQQLPLPAPRKTFPPQIDNDLHSTDAMAALPNPRLVARHIQAIKTTQGPSDVQIELSTRDQQLGFGIKVQTRLEMKN